MEKVIIGTILKNRIKQCGYTQKRFADEVGIDIETLKGYMRGKNAYTYETLDILSNALNCSYDYLLGYSTSPEREYHEIKEQTLLSDESIEILCSWYKKADTDEMCELKAELLDEIIRNEDFLIFMLMYCASNRIYERINNEIIKQTLGITNRLIDVNKDNDYKNIAIGKSILLCIMQEIDNIKYRMSPELYEKMKKDLRTVENNLKRE